MIRSTSEVCVMKDSVKKDRDDFFSVAEVSKMFDIPEERLRYWAHTGFIGPKVRHRGRRYYNFQDLISIKVAKSLMESGHTLQQIRRSLDALRRQLPGIEAPLARLRIRSDRDRIVVEDGNGAFDAKTGQLMLDFDLSQLREDVARIVSLPWVSSTSKSDESTSTRSSYEWFVLAGQYEVAWNGVDFEATELRDAKSAYEQAIASDPNFAAAWTNLGTLHAQTGDLDSARDCFDQAVQCDPEQAEARCNLAELALRMGDADLAIEGFRQVLRNAADHIEAHYGLARALISVGGHAQALAHLERFCEAVDRLAQTERNRELEGRRACAVAAIETIRSECTQES